MTSPRQASTLLVSVARVIGASGKPEAQVTA